MNENADFFEMERVVFFNGLRLTAQDLTAAQDATRELRWLHNRSLHQWGIAAGLAAIGAKGARQVTVAPGYALDARGREIVLAESQTLPVPPLSGENNQPAVRDLTIAFPSDDEVEVSETRQGICAPRGAVRLAETSKIRWLETSQVRPGYDIVLARASILNCQLDAPLSLVQRRNARPPQQPAVACGRTPVGKTVWTAWTDPVFGSNTVLGFQTLVDTSAAHFNTTPRYLARLAGERISPPILNLENPFTIDGFTVIDSPGTGSFLFRVLMPRINFRGAGANQIVLNPTTFIDSPEAPRLLGEERGWHVVWVGIEG